jgi:hypothetical protein
MVHLISDASVHLGIKRAPMWFAICEGVGGGWLLVAGGGAVQLQLPAAATATAIATNNSACAALRAFAAHARQHQR